MILKKEQRKYSDERYSGASMKSNEEQMKEIEQEISSLGKSQENTLEIKRAL